MTKNFLINLKKNNYMWNKLGTWTTIDCPTQKQDEAFQFLVNEFNKIGGNVRKTNNPHELGDYPSFEIDYPEDSDFGWSECPFPVRITYPID